MATCVRLRVSRAKHEPGEVVQAALEVRLEGRAGNTCRIENVTVVVAGIERVDTSWVKRSYWNNDGFEKGSGCATRSIFEGKAEKIHEDLLLQDGNACLYHVSFRLPKKLPPSFRGRTVQYYYSIHAHAKVQEDESKTVTAVAYLPVVLGFEEMGGEEGLGSLALQEGSNRVEYGVGEVLEVDLDEPMVDALFARGHGDGSPEDQVGVKQFRSYQAEGLARTAHTNGTRSGTGSLMHGIGKRQIDSPVSSLSHSIALPGHKQPSYNLHVGGVQFARFSVHPPRCMGGKNDICLGNNLAGFLDFRVASRQVISETGEKVRCLGVTATLESKEEVSQEWVAGYTSSDSAIFHRVHCELSESTVDTVVTNILLTVPRFNVLRNDSVEAEEIHWALPIRIGPERAGGIIADYETHSGVQGAAQVSKEVSLKT